MRRKLAIAAIAVLFTMTTLICWLERIFVADTGTIDPTNLTATYGAELFREQMAAWTQTPQP